MSTTSPVPGAPFVTAAKPGHRFSNGRATDSSAAEQPGLNKPSIRTASITPECNGKPLFNPGCGDIKLMVNDICFETHEYLLRRFSILKRRLEKRPSDGVLQLERYEHDVQDFHNTFKILYASVLEGPFEFDSTILVSALRVASLYDYPALRSYAIQHLELANLTAIERIKISREFGLKSWEEPAYKELYARKEPITVDEARVLGLDDYVRIVTARERTQQRADKANVPVQGPKVNCKAGAAGSEDPAMAMVKVIACWVLWLAIAAPWIIGFFWDELAGFIAARACS